MYCLVGSHCTVAFSSMVKIHPKGSKPLTALRTKLTDRVRIGDELFFKDSRACCTEGLWMALDVIVDSAYVANRNAAAAAEHWAIKLT